MASARISQLTCVPGDGTQEVAPSTGSSVDARASAGTRGKNWGASAPRGADNLGYSHWGLVLRQDMLTHWFAANFSPSSMPISLALTYDACQPLPALYAAFFCRDLPHILGLPLCESCARVTWGRLCPRAPNRWQEGRADEGRAPSMV